MRSALVEEIPPQTSTFGALQEKRIFLVFHLRDSRDRANLSLNTVGVRVSPCGLHGLCFGREPQRAGRCSCWVLEGSACAPSP